MAAPILRPFQAKLKGEVFQAWNQGARNVVMRLATGGGKTVTLADAVREHAGVSCVIAHRSELVGQLSLTLAKYGVRHRIVGADATRKAISKLHVDVLGHSWVDENARCIVASIDTLVRRDVGAWAALVTLWVVDEGHHLVLDNKWHAGISLFTNRDVRGLLPTATPGRADRKGLGRPEIGGAGVADVMVEGPEMRWLIDQGYLSDYRIICPKSDMVVLEEAGASGDWSTKQLREAAERSHIVGDVVQAYRSWGAGLTGVTFATDVATAGEMSLAYQRAGFNAEVLTGKTDDYVRRTILKMLEDGRLDMVVAVDIISEGFDLPGIGYLGMARPTQSLPLYMQQFGRALRASPGKTHAVVVDHVANVIRHNGPPDKPRLWSLQSVEKRKSSEGVVKFRVCPECLTPYEAYRRSCPECGWRPEPAGRESPAMVEGDLAELDPAVLHQLRQAAHQVDESLEEVRSRMAAQGWSHVVGATQLKHHANRQNAQTLLRAAMATWGGRWRYRGLDDPEIQRAFWQEFGISVVEAMALHARDADALREKLERITAHV